MCTARACTHCKLFVWAVDDAILISNSDEEWSKGSLHATAPRQTEVYFDRGKISRLASQPSRNRGSENGWAAGCTARSETYSKSLTKVHTRLPTEHRMRRRFSISSLKSPRQRNSATSPRRRYKRAEDTDAQRPNSMIVSSENCCISSSVAPPRLSECVVKVSVIPSFERAFANQLATRF